MSDPTWRDVEAVETLLACPPKPWIFLPMGSVVSETQLLQAVQWAAEGQRLAAFVVETTSPMSKSVIVRLVDLPHLAVAIYDRLTGQR